MSPVFHRHTHSKTAFINWSTLPGSHFSIMVPGNGRRRPKPVGGGQEVVLVRKEKKASVPPGRATAFLVALFFPFILVKFC